MTGTLTHRPPRSVGDVIAGRQPQRARQTHQPVRRNSYNRGEREGRFWSTPDRDQLRATFEAAKRHDLLTKKKGARNGALGHVALQVLEFMIRDIDWKDGALEPAIAYIMAHIRRSRDAVVRALRKLKDAGFLDWMRRSEPVEDAEGAGPRVRQISNAYRILVPASWAQRVKSRVAQFRLWRKATSPAAKPTERPIEDPELAALLARMEAGIERRDASPPSGQIPGAAL